MRLLHNSLVSMLIVTALAWSSAAHAERRIVIIHDPGPQGPSLEMSTQMVASARAAAAKEAQDAADAGQPLARPQQIKLPQMEVSAIATTVDGRREVLLRRASYRLDKIAARLEVLEGYLVAYLNLDRVIEIIRTEDEPKPVMIA